MKHNLWNLMAGIKNGYMAKKYSVLLTKNTLCINVLQLLWDEGFISGFRTEKSNLYKVRVFMKYNKFREPSLNSIKSISKPSKRIFYSHKQLWKFEKNSDSVLIFSTTKGVMTLKNCKKNKIGGELIFDVF